MDPKSRRNGASVYDDDESVDTSIAMQQEEEELERQREAARRESLRGLKRAAEEKADEPSSKRARLQGGAGKRESAAAAANSDDEVRVDEDVKPEVKRIEYKDGSLYYGAVTVVRGRSMAQGRGRYSTSTGMCIEGNWVKDCIVGEASEFRPNNELKYKGQWLWTIKSRAYHGDGEFHHRDGWMYTGQFEEGFMHGEGTVTLKDNTTITGMWERSRCKGPMVVTGPDAEDNGTRSDAEAQALIPEEKLQMEYVSSGSRVNDIEGNLVTMLEALGQDENGLLVLRQHMEHALQDIQTARSDVTTVFMGNNGTGKSFFINSLMLITLVDPHRYESKEWQDAGKRELRELQDGLAGINVHQFEAVSRDQWSPFGKAVKDYAAPPNAPFPQNVQGYILPCSSNPRVTTALNIHLLFGYRFYLKVVYQSIDDMRNSARPFCLQVQELRIAGSQDADILEELQGLDNDLVRNHNLWRAITGRPAGVLPLDEDDCDPDEVLRKLAGTVDLFIGEGISMDEDREYIAHELRKINSPAPVDDPLSRREFRIHAAINTLTVHLPCKLLEGGGEIVDAPGFLDSNILRLTQQRKILERARTVVLLMNRDITASGDVLQHIRQSQFWKQLLASPDQYHLSAVLYRERESAATVRTITSTETRSECENAIKATKQEIEKALRTDLKGKGAAVVRNAMEQGVSCLAAYPTLFASLLTGDAVPLQEDGQPLDVDRVIDATGCTELLGRIDMTTLMAVGKRVSDLQATVRDEKARLENPVPRAAIQVNPAALEECKKMVRLFSGSKKARCFKQLEEGPLKSLQPMFAGLKQELVEVSKAFVRGLNLTARGAEQEKKWMQFANQFGDDLADLRAALNPVFQGDSRIKKKDTLADTFFGFLWGIDFSPLLSDITARVLGLASTFTAALIDTIVHTYFTDKSVHPFVAAYINEEGTRYIIARLERFGSFNSRCIMTPSAVKTHIIDEARSQLVDIILKSALKRMQRDELVEYVKKKIPKFFRELGGAICGRLESDIAMNCTSLERDILETQAHKEPGIAKYLALLSLHHIVTLAEPDTEQDVSHSLQAAVDQLTAMEAVLHASLATIQGVSPAIIGKRITDDVRQSHFLRGIYQQGSAVFGRLQGQFRSNDTRPFSPIPNLREYIPGSIIQVNGTQQELEALLDANGLCIEDAIRDTENDEMDDLIHALARNFADTGTAKDLSTVASQICQQMCFGLLHAHMSLEARARFNETWEVPLMTYVKEVTTNDRNVDESALPFFCAGFQTMVLLWVPGVPGPYLFGARNARRTLHIALLERRDNDCRFATVRRVEAGERSSRGGRGVKRAVEEDDVSQGPSKRRTTLRSRRATLDASVSASLLTDEIVYSVVDVNVTSYLVVNNIVKRIHEHQLARERVRFVVPQSVKANLAELQNGRPNVEPHKSARTFLSHMTEFHELFIEQETWEHSELLALYRFEGCHSLEAELAIATANLWRLRRKTVRLLQNPRSLSVKIKGVLQCGRTTVEEFHAVARQALSQPEGDFRAALGL